MMSRCQECGQTKHSVDELVTVIATIGGGTRNLFEFKYHAAALQGIFELIDAAEELLDHTNRDYDEWREPVREALAKIKGGG